MSTATEQPKDALQIFFETIANDPWTAIGIRDAARTALLSYAPQPEAPVVEAEAKPKAQPRSSAGHAGGGGR